MRVVGLAAAALVACAGPVLGQSLELDVFGVSVTDRGDERVGVQGGNGFGVGGAVEGHLGRFAAEGQGFMAKLSASDGGNERDVHQLGFRTRFDLLSVLAMEASVLNRSFSPDAEGTALGFVSAGIRSEFIVGGRGRFWGRVAYIPYARFSGGGSASFAMEAGLGFALAVIGERVVVTGQYGFQRIDRTIEGLPTRFDEARSSIEFDTVEIGIALRLGGARPDGRATGPTGEQP